MELVSADWFAYPHNKEIPVKNIMVIITTLFLVVGCNTEAQKDTTSQKDMPPAEDTSAASYSGTVLSSQDASNYTYLEIKGKMGSFGQQSPGLKFPPVPQWNLLRRM